MKKVKKTIFSILLIILILAAFFLVKVYLYDYTYLNPVTDYEIDAEIDHNFFYGEFTVAELRNEVKDGGILVRYHLTNLPAILARFDDDTRIVISFGSGIRYFWTSKLSEHPEVLNVKYLSNKPKNRVYIYTSDYPDKIVDVENFK